MIHRAACLFSNLAVTKLLDAAAGIKSTNVQLSGGLVAVGTCKCSNVASPTTAAGNQSARKMM